MHIALVNTNRMQPPLAPIGLDYLAEALCAAGHTISLLDLCWEREPDQGIVSFFRRSDFGLVGVSFRNTDDCGFLSKQTFVPDLAGFVDRIKASTDAPVVLGGVGFSVMPMPLLSLVDAEAGLWGEGEFVFPELASRIKDGREWRDLPGLVWKDVSGCRRNPPVFPSLAKLPPMSRGWVDNPRYFRFGGQAGFETKRGCPCLCTYCADPVAKGNRVRVRPPQDVAGEMEKLLELGVDHLHTCDGEFNVPEWHALAVCREICRRGLGSRLSWYAYCSPAPFSRELARAMREAGCLGINFGADSGDAEMLRRLRRNFTPDEILNASAWSKSAGMAVMFDLLLGSPGESRQSLERTIELMKQADPAVVGVSVGVRVYPGTELARELDLEDACAAEPVFHLEPEVAHFIFQLLETSVAGDRRFLFLDPSKPGRNYNYNANQRLSEAIRNGARGAWWDILRRQ
jgi:radical SAM superfamily enzyme YgiQ (UPF0313 family)